MSLKLDVKAGIWELPTYTDSVSFESAFGCDLYLFAFFRYHGLSYRTMKSIFYCKGLISAVEYVLWPAGVFVLLDS